jgi:hypothetical protein
MGLRRLLQRLWKFWYVVKLIPRSRKSQFCWIDNHDAFILALRVLNGNPTYKVGWFPLRYAMSTKSLVKLCCKS